MSALIPFLATLAVGATFTLAGYFGPEDGGTLELIGLAIVAIALFGEWK